MLEHLCYKWYDTGMVPVNDNSEHSKTSKALTLRLSPERRADVRLLRQVYGLRGMAEAIRLAIRLQAEQVRTTEHPSHAAKDCE